MTYVAIINKHGQVTIPKEIWRARCWKAGTRISIVQGEGASFILRAAEIPQSKPELLFTTSMPNIDAHELAGQARMLLGILGLEGDHRASAIDVENHLVALLYTSGAWALKVLLGQAAAISLSSGAGKALAELHTIICALLGKRPPNILMTAAGRSAVQGAVKN
ncbi:hypothetical protein EJD96_22075 [Herbaspirillum seropedicae]|uniref:AbrB/MazE/SpoVT family DNA-binding domain-containing protein n=1 Tax=Herbaspirillum seropedicae TaxID=964 RepID=UPI0011227404|nr:AbrB/MazE/SpoVT family DNA-binding domain-containing protein [Herbaspirillum seropedicae]QDD66658.1 hypothetical protein EJD96_22075 [Herbaspirillum seropedicae]